MRFPKISRRNPFAHLNTRHADVGDEDDNRSDDVADDQNQEVDRSKDDDDSDSSTRARRAVSRQATEDEDDDDTSAEDQNEQDDEGEKAEEDDGDDRTDAEDDDDIKTARIRSREKGRCAYIFSSKSAARNPAAAAQIAFGTSLPRKQAVALLQSLSEVPPPQNGRSQERPGARLRTRMRQNPVGAVGMDQHTPREERPGMSIVAACKKYSIAPRGK